MNIKADLESGNRNKLVSGLSDLNEALEKWDRRLNKKLKRS